MRFTLGTSVFALAVSTVAAGQRSGMAIPITKRSGLVNADKSVNIEALKSHVVSVEANILRGFDNFKKNTGASHPAALKGNKRRGTGAVASNEALVANEHQWYGSLAIGTPASTFNVTFNTGLSDLFLPGPNCDSTCDGHVIYNPSASSTSKDLNQPYLLQYRDGSNITGEQYSETVTVAGLTATDQSFCVATVYSPRVAKKSFIADGVMGLGFQTTSFSGATPVFQNLISQGQVDQPVFSFKLTTSGLDSEFYLGGVNKALYTGDFTYTNVTQEGFWQVKTDHIKGNGKIIMSDMDTIFVSTAPVIEAPPWDVAKVHEVLGGTNASSTVGTGFYTFPCDSFPSVSLTFGGRTFPISKDTLNIGHVSPNSTDCISGIVGSTTGLPYWAVGAPFLQNVYTTFDVGNARVGFAQLA